MAKYLRKHGRMVGKEAFPIAHSMNKGGMIKKDIAAALKFSEATIHNWLVHPTYEAYTLHMEESVKEEAKKTSTVNGISKGERVILSQLNGMTGILRSLDDILSRIDERQEVGQDEESV